MEANEKRREAILLLRKYDKMKKEVSLLQLQLSRACIDYGRATGAWGYTADMLRRDVAQEQDKRKAS